jgi:hypothetical protein
MTALTSLIGHAGSRMVLRRSLRLTEREYPWLDELREVGLEDLPTVLTAALSQHPKDVAEKAWIAIFTSVFHLLVALIGERLVLQIVHETWPDVFKSSQ